MNFFSPLRTLLQGWLFSLLGWGLVAGLVIAAQLPEHRGQTQAVVWEAVRDWLPWAILTPLLFRLAFRLPLTREHRASAVPTHLLVAIVALSGLHWWRLSFPVSRSMNPGPPPPPEWGDPFGPPGPPPARPPAPPPGPEGLLFRLFRSDLPLYLMILSAAHATLFFRREKERAASLAQARLEALRMQLQPHFLFNSLNTIAGLVHEEPDRAEAMIVALSELLRLTLASSGEAELPLARELQFVERYLAIMHARFEGKLHFELLAEPEVKAALVPSFLLQPLVEEAVQQELQVNRHGGRVKLRAWRDGGLLRLSVEDSGGGAAALTLPAAESLGLQNARERLRQLYGKKATLLLDQSGGCTVTISLPFHTHAAP